MRQLKVIHFKLLRKSVDVILVSNYDLLRCVFGKGNLVSAGLKFTYSQFGFRKGNIFLASK